MEKTAIVYNPVSGGGRGEEVFRFVSGRLGELGVPFTAYRTEASGAAADCAKRALEEGAERVIVLGGDGTIHETAQVLAGTEAALGIIPCGSGNDLVRTLNIPKDPEKALSIALNGKARRMDAGLANGELFFNVAGCGFDVDVLLNERKLHNISKNGSVAYYLALIRSLLHLTIRTAKAEWENGRLEAGVLIAAAANGSFFGGGMKIAPGADPFDGQLDFCIIKDVHWYDIPFLLPKFLSGTHIKSKKVLFFRGTELSLECEPASMLELDGEIQPGTPVRFKIVPGALKVMVEA